MHRDVFLRSLHDYIGSSVAIPHSQAESERVADNLTGHFPASGHAGRFPDFGPIVDRFGHKALLVPSCIIVLLGMEGLAFFESVPLLQASIVGIGLGGGILNGETNALVSDISGESEKGSRLSFLGMFYGLGALGIPMLLGSLSRHYSFETILLGIGVVMLAGIIFCIPVRFPAPKQAQGFPVKEGLGLLKESSLLLLSFILFSKAASRVSATTGPRVTLGR